MRKTYGYQKKQDYISLTQFQLGTGMNRSQVVDTIKSLVCKRILVKNKSIYALNKNWEEWVVCKRILVCKSILPSMQKHTKTSMQKHTHKRKKETSTKETTSKGKPLRFNPLGVEIIKEMEIVDPKNKNYYNNTTQRGACDFLIEQYGLEEVRKRISVLPKTNKIAYFPTITTPAQLRDKWVQLQDAVDRKRSELQAKNTVAFT